MSPAQLLAHFDRLSEAPDAVSRLRRFILDLAVRGKLTEQNPNDDSAEEMLRRIHTVREAKTGLRRSACANRPIRDEEIPFAAPPGTVFGRLADLATIEKGSTAIQKAKPGPYPLVTLAEQRASSADYQFDVAAAIVPLVSSTGHGHASLKRLHYQEGKFALGNILCAVVPIAPDLVSARFIYEYLWAYREPLLIEKMSGTANVSLTIGKIGDAPIPMVPPRSQARLHDLMVLCDRLEAAQTERETRRDRLVAASLNRLNEPAADDTQAFRDHARFHICHLPRLTTRTEHIGQLRNTILSLAVRGRLVPQDPSDEPAAVQLASSDRVRQETAKDDRRAGAHCQTLLATDERWSVPASWEWRGLADLALFIDYRGKTPKKIGDGIRLITAKNVRRGVITLDPEEFLSESEYKRWMTRGFPKIGDVLFTTEAPMGNAATVRLADRFALAQRVICFRLYGAIDPDFLVIQLLSEPFQRILNGAATGLTAKGIKAAKLKRLPMAVPPLAEQRRIVGKAEELMALCDRAEFQLSSIHTESRRLLEAVLHQALTPTIEKARGPSIRAG